MNIEDVYGPPDDKSLYVQNNTKGQPYKSPLKLIPVLFILSLVSFGTGYYLQYTEKEKFRKLVIEQANLELGAAKRRPSLYLSLLFDINQNQSQKTKWLMQGRVKRAVESGWFSNKELEFARNYQKTYCSDKCLGV